MFVCLIIFTSLLWPKSITSLRIAMKDRESRQPVFVGPSLGVSILCAIPLVAPKLLEVVEMSWLWATCPIWLGWVVCFFLWMWFSSLSLVCKSLKPVYVPVFVSSSSSEIEKDDKENEKENKEDGV